MAQAVCIKYDCKASLNDFMHIMTLASGFWAVKSLGLHDEGIKQTFIDFFDNNKHLKQLLLNEQTAFGNYIVSLVAYAAIKDNPNINLSLSIYEKLGPAQDALKAWANGTRKD